MLLITVYQLVPASIFITFYHILPVYRYCIYVGTMNSTSTAFVVGENFADENVSADKSASEYKVLSPQRSILKDLNVSNICHSSPKSLDTAKVITVTSHNLICILYYWTFQCELLYLSVLV